jgi:hypothetical protein
MGLLDTFSFFSAFSSTFGFKVSKKVLIHCISKRIFLEKIRYGYREEQNLMLSWNPLKKGKENNPKEVKGRKLLHAVIKNLIFCHFFADNFFRMVFWNFSE